MGLAGGLVKRVFSKGHKASPSTGRDSNDRHTLDKNRWILSKLNFCGDDFDSVHVEANDLASLMSSEVIMAKADSATPEENGALATSDIIGREEQEAVRDAGVQDEREEGPANEGSFAEQTSNEERAALVIQSAFRGFLVRRQCEHNKLLGMYDEVDCCDRVSLSTSIEVQTGDSVKNLVLKEETANIPSRVPQKSRTQTSRFKQEWDDSTVSSNISKLRYQNRLEAMTRRERALAYAFSQQLRACSAKKKYTLNDSSDQSMGWKWLERWMATRLPESSFSDDCSNRHLEPNYRPMIVKKRIELALAEKESCGSNDVSVNLDEHSEIVKHSSISVKNRLKAPSTSSRRNSTSNCHYVTPTGKVAKVVSLREAWKQKQNKQIQTKVAEEIRCGNTSKEEEMPNVDNSLS